MKRTERRPRIGNMAHGWRRRVKKTPAGLLPFKGTEAVSFPQARAVPSPLRYLCGLFIDPLRQDPRVRDIGRGSPHCLRGDRPRLPAIGFANKIARMAWAMMASGERYREPFALAT